MSNIQRAHVDRVLSLTAPWRHGPALLGDTGLPSSAPPLVASPASAAEAAAASLPPLLIFVPTSWLRWQQYKMLSLVCCQFTMNHPTSVTYAFIQGILYLQDFLVYLYHTYLFYCCVVKVDDHVNT
ncbi:hypothetical protein ACQJBY_009391 [Aegilops geniculata]